MTRSGQVRSASRMGSTLLGEGTVPIDRHRRTPRWVFHAGWPTLGWPAGLVMVRLMVNTSGESPDG